MINRARQAPVFDIGRFDFAVDVIGLGGVGSYLMLHLKKLGIGRVRGFDAKTVSDVNPPNQLHGPQHAGLLKAESLLKIVSELAGDSFESHAIAVTKDIPLSDIVFICVDSMETRKEIMEGIFARGSATKLVVETRIDANFVVIHTVIPANADHQEMWNHFWFPDAEAENNFGCSDPVSLGATSSVAADIAVSQMIQWFGNGANDLGMACDNQIRISMRPFSAEVTQW